jgi:chromosome condensin MukBEF complex kleisin-like MukF subunit
LNCGLCKLPISGAERYCTDHYKCSADLHQSFRDDIAKAEAQRDELLAENSRLKDAMNSLGDELRMVSVRLCNSTIGVGDIRRLLDK